MVQKQDGRLDCLSDGGIIMEYFISKQIQFLTFFIFFMPSLSPREPGTTLQVTQQSDAGARVQLS